MAKVKIKFKVGDIIGYWEYLGEVHVLHSYLGESQRLKSWDEALT